MLQKLLTNGKEKIHMVQRRKEIIKSKFFENVEKSRKMLDFWQNKL